MGRPENRRDWKLALSIALGTAAWLSAMAGLLWGGRSGRMPTVNPNYPIPCYTPGGYVNPGVTAPVVHVPEKPCRSPLHDAASGAGKVLKFELRAQEADERVAALEARLAAAEARIAALEARFAPVLPVADPLESGRPEISEQWTICGQVVGARPDHAEVRP